MRTCRSGSLSLRSFEEPAYPEESVIRLLLTEEEKAELVRIDAKNKYFFESHIPAIVWSRKHYGYRIQDMIDRHYFDVINLIQKYMPTDPLLKTISDPVSVDSYLSTIFNWFPKTQSLVAIKEGTREIIGVLIGRLVIEPEWFELVSRIQFVTKKDKYAYLKRGFKKDAVDEKPKSKPGSAGKRMSKAPRASQAGKRASKTPKDGSKRASKAGGGSRKSMGAKGGSRKSMGAKGGSRKSMGASGGRKSMGAKGGSRKSMGAGGGGRKSMGAGGGRKSMGAGGGRKSMGAKGARKSMGGGSRKSITGGGKGGKGGRHSVKDRKPGEWKIARPVDIVPEEPVPIVQATIFDDDEVVYPDNGLQSLHSFKKKLAARIRIWKMIKRRMYYRIYLTAVSPKYQRMEVLVSLVESLKTMCYAFNVSTIAGVMTTFDAQNAFYYAGGLIVYEVLYKHYPVFESADVKSYDRSAAVVFMEIPLAPTPAEASTKEGKKSRGKF